MQTIHRILFAFFIFGGFLFSGCSTFEIGIENNVLPETGEVIPTATGQSPTDEFVEIVSTIPAPTAIPSDDQQIAAALAEKIGQPIDQLSYAVTAINGNYATGGISNGYFLAARQGDSWVIVYDGQANPPCSQLELYEFPIEMAPECLNGDNQVIKRTAAGGSDIGDALAIHLDIPVGEVQYTIMQDAGEHMMGYLPGGYFLAAKVNDAWQIIFSGNGTPYCSMVDIHNFPAYIVPECVDANGNLVYRQDSESDFLDLQSLDCGPGSPGANPETIAYVACNIQDALRSRNISALLGIMEDPFIIGYWLSEGVFYAPEDFLTYLPQLYNFNDPDYSPRLTFTTDRSEFPVLDGRPVEDRFGPDVNVVEVIFSRGWGADGDEEAMLFLVQDAAGDIKWRSMLLGDLDVPMPGPVN